MSHGGHDVAGGKSRRAIVYSALAAGLVVVGLAIGWRVRRPSPPIVPIARSVVTSDASTGDARFADTTTEVHDAAAAPDVREVRDVAGPSTARGRHAFHRDAAAVDAVGASRTVVPPEASGPAEVSVRSSPFGYVRVDGGPEYPSPTPTLRLAPGAHHARVRYPGMGGAEAEFTFEVTAGERRVIVVSPSGG